MKDDFEKLIKDVKENSNPSDLYDAKELDDIIENCIIDTNIEYEKEKTIMQFIEEDSKPVDILSLGNISVSIGAAKSRKTFFSSMMLSAFASDKQEFAMSGDLLGRKALFIDTEQSKYHVQRVGKRIKRIIKKSINDSVDIIALRELPTKNIRLAVVEHILKKSNDYCFICIDGIVDLVNDFNNLDECSNTVLRIMSWSSLYNCHINCVIHTNKDGNNARGHLGAELINKAEAAFRVAKDESNTTIVKCEASRNAPFEDFSFTVNGVGLPERCMYPNGYFDNTPKLKTYEDIHPCEHHQDREIEPSKEFSDDAPF